VFVPYGAGFWNKFDHSKLLNQPANAFANDCRKVNQRADQCSGNNTRFAVNQRKRQAQIRSTKPIPPCTEVFVPYGAGFWNKFDHSKLLNQPAKQKRE